MVSPQISLLHLELEQATASSQQISGWQQLI
jgi:hypothetical protein